MYCTPTKYQVLKHFKNYLSVPNYSTDRHFCHPFLHTRKVEHGEVRSLLRAAWLAWEYAGI